MRVMKALTPVFLIVAAGLGLVWVRAQPAGTNAEPVVPKLSAEQIARYTSLARRQLETEAQSRLLKEMARDHNLRSQEATRERLADQARWENDLALELDKKADDLLKQSNAVAQERVRFEEQNRVLDATLPGGLTPDENAYLARLDEHLNDVQRELSALAVQAAGYNAELQTNSTPDDVARISDLIQANGIEVRHLQKAQSELELKKLEFRAVRR